LIDYLYGTHNENCAGRVKQRETGLETQTDKIVSPGHVFGTVFRPTCMTTTLHTAVSGVNSTFMF